MDAVIDRAVGAQEPEAASILERNNPEAYEFGLVELEMEFFDGSDNWPSHCAAMVDGETQGLVLWTFAMIVSEKALDLGISATGGEVVTHRANLVSVTGILMIDDNVRGVEYEWNYVPSELGRALGLESSENERGEAVLRRYDDGWRIVD